MATFFGEILPVTSRAVDDDEEDDDVTLFPQCNPVIHWSKSFSAQNEKLPDQKVPCTVFIIAVGTEANAFTEIYVKPFGYEAIGGVFTSLRDDDCLTFSSTSSTEKTCYFYQCRNNPSVLLCQCKVDVLPEHSYAWARLFIDSLDLSTADIVVLTSSGMSGYCSDLPLSDLETPLLRFLKTENYSEIPKCKILDQPNMVYQCKAVMYVCFKEKRYMDIADVKIFIPALHTLPMKDITEVNKNAEQMLRDIVKLHSLQDMMYM